MPPTPPTPSPSPEALGERLRRLGLYGLLAQGQALLGEPWLERVIAIEEAERQRRSLKRRLDHARLGSFKSDASPSWACP
jgi:hypothetical protein